MRACIVAYRRYECNTHMMQFANALVRRGDTVDVLCVGAAGANHEDIVDGVQVWRIQRRDLDEASWVRYTIRLGSFIIRAALVLARRHLVEPYQLVHVQSVPDFLIFAAIVPKLLRTPVILDFRDLVPELYASRTGAGDGSRIFRLLLFLERISCALADHVLIANPLWYERIGHRSVSPSKCTLFWYVPDPTLFHLLPRLRNDNTFRITYPGNLNHHQGVDIAVQAFPKILRDLPTAEFYIYGDGSERKALAAQIARMNLEEKVKLLGILPVQDVPQAMAESDVGIVPKRVSCQFGNEAASTKIFEFMAVGVPVVASRTKIDECYFDDSLVRFFKSEDEDALAEAVLSIYRDPELRDRLVENGARFIQEGKWGSRISDYLDIVDSLTEPAARRPYQCQQSR